MQKPDKQCSLMKTAIKGTAFGISWWNGINWTPGEGREHFEILTFSVGGNGEKPRNANSE
jgi:hypothetical protein